MQNHCLIRLVALVGICVFLLGSPPALSDDCNNNGVPDDQDISTGTSEDCNSNSIPDECEVYVENKLTASDAAEGDHFGKSVAICGDVAVIGVPLDDDHGHASGSAYIYRRVDNSWIVEAKLTASDAGPSDNFGFSVAIEGNVAVIGARLLYDAIGGAAYIFRFNGSSWVEEAKLTASGSDYFGHSVAISGNVVVIGDDSNDDAGSNAGAAYVFRFNGTSWVEEAKLIASDAAAKDKFGCSVSVSGDLAVIGAHWADDAGDGSGSAYVYRFNGTSWVEEAKLTASDAAAKDSFGNSVSISGNVVLVGSWQDDDDGAYSGSAYVYRFDGTSWNEDTKLTASDATEGDKFGSSVSISGDVAVIGAREDGDFPGSAYVYRWDGTSWIQEAKLIASDTADVGAFGYAVATSGDAAVIGAYSYDGVGNNSGAAYIFSIPTPELAQDCNVNGIPDDCEPDCNGNGVPDDCDIRDGTSQDCNGNGMPDECDIANGISEDCDLNGIPDECEVYVEHKLTADDAEEADHFGRSVAISGDIAVIGVPLDDDNDYASGSAYIYRRSGSDWIVEAKLTASDGARMDEFGESVAVSGDVVVIGAGWDDDGGGTSGSAYVFRFNGTSWIEEAKLTASDASPGDRFGYSVSISGEVAIIGAYHDGDDYDRFGAAYVYRYNGDRWVEDAKLTASDAARKDEFGGSVSISGNVAVIGARWDDDDGDGSGSAYVYRFNGIRWIEEVKLTASDPAVLDEFGKSVSVSGNVVLVGAWQDDDDGDYSGSAYVYRFDGSSWIEETKLTASDATEGDKFGSSVSISGDVAVIGAREDGDFPGSAYVYRWGGSIWIQEAKLQASDTTNLGAFGSSVATSGNAAVIGAYGYDGVGNNSGAAYIFSIPTPELAQDCNGNGIPDACEPDCNRNGMPDDCDIIYGTSLDDDNDGVPDECDSCLGSDLSETIVIDGCDTGVANQALGNGCTMADEIAEAAETAKNHGDFASQVAHLTNTWKRDGLITGPEKGQIQSCTNGK